MKNENFILECDLKDGGIKSLNFSDDENQLNWIEGNKNYGTPYGGNYGVIGDVEISENQLSVKYNYNGLIVKVIRKLTQNGLIDNYNFINEGTKTLKFKKGELGINTPFNDNYESANVCLTKKCHMHIWCGENTAYVACKRMNGEKNNLALILSQGKINGYAIYRAWDSNDRGDLSLLLGECEFAPSENLVIEFLLVKYDDFADFYSKAIKVSNFLSIDSSKYSLKVNECVEVELKTTNIGPISSNYGEVKKIAENRYLLKLKFDEIGEKKLIIKYGEYITSAEFFVFNDVLDIIDKRLNFIIDNQICREEGKFNGAIKLYDNEDKKTFVENFAWNDRNYARERICMVISMIERLLYGNLSNNFKAKLLENIKLCMDFVDRAIVKDDGNVYEKPNYKRICFHDRLYNYSWYMNLYTLMFKLTKEIKYLNKACNIAKKYYKKGGAKFYAIGLPFETLYLECQNGGYKSLAEEVKALFLTHGDRIIEIGDNYPAHEVKYEQSIVAPSVDTLLECYLISQDKKYLDEAERQLPKLEAFNGEQPSYHLNEVAIRHWDGFWFGKRKMYGDTFPHYWSCITASVYSKYARITTKMDYQKRADKCFNNNLCLLNEGVGSSAYIYPDFINGKPGKFFDPWANDQDWVMFYNLRYNMAIKS